jgi:hypothetical protein
MQRKGNEAHSSTVDVTVSTVDTSGEENRLPNVALRRGLIPINSSRPRRYGIGVPITIFLPRV